MTRLLAWLGALVAVYFAFLRERHLHGNATPAEARGELAGDELSPDAPIVAARVVEIDAPASAVWPWLVQMARAAAAPTPTTGSRAGSASTSATSDRVVPELQDLKVGDEIQIPGYAMRVERLEPERALVLANEDLTIRDLAERLAREGT